MVFKIFYLIFLNLFISLVLILPGQLPNQISCAIVRVIGRCSIDPQRGFREDETRDENIVYCRNQYNMYLDNLRNRQDKRRLDRVRAGKEGKREGAARVLKAM